MANKSLLTIFTVFLFGANIAVSTEGTPRVLILGAGMSGIAAAKTLADSGVDDFLILEGDSDIGGRVKSTSFGGQLIELGANWVHFGNSSDNPIWQLKEKYNIRGKHSDYDDVIVLDNAGNNFTHIADDYWEMWEFAGEYIDEYLLDDMLLGRTPDMSVRAGRKLGGWTPRNAVQKVVEYFEHDAEFADPPDVSSLRSTSANSDELVSGGGDYFITDQRGFGTIIKEMANEFLSEGDERLKLGHLVSRIEWSDDNVTVTTSDDQVFTADFALCTFSIGVLENDVVEFVPELPLWKTEEIYQFRMAWFTKIFLQFPADSERFWPEEEWMLVADDRRGYYPVWGNLGAPGLLPNEANILFVMVTGEESRRVEYQSDEETKVEIMSVLRNMFGDDIPDASDILVSKWGIDPLHYGSYSNWPVEVSMESFVRLQAPVGKLYFAGEATHERYNGYLQGALLTGQDRADDILRCMDGSCYEHEIKRKKLGCTYQQATNYDDAATIDDGSCIFNLLFLSSGATCLKKGVYPGPLAPATTDSFFFVCAATYVS
ncbi:uncharacterized protein [Ptychodera flava]|uniref:uncharacterized protein n=1 Tax=Ptychodera flava TaxID=63121 RepID=UPI00396A5437